jgi:hypothetical protein
MITLEVPIGSDGEAVSDLSTVLETTQGSAGTVFDMTKYVIQLELSIFQNTVLYYHKYAIILSFFYLISSLPDGKLQKRGFLVHELM